VTCLSTENHQEESKEQKQRSCIRPSWPCGGRWNNRWC